MNYKDKLAACSEYEQVSLPCQAEITALIFIVNHGTYVESISWKEGLLEETLLATVLSRGYGTWG